MVGKKGNKKGTLPPRSVREKKKQSRITKAEAIGLIFAGVGIFSALILGALTAAGVVDMSAARYLLFAAWVSAVVMAYVVEKLSARSQKRILISVSATAVVAGLFLFVVNNWMVNKKAQTTPLPSRSSQ